MAGLRRFLSRTWLVTALFVLTFTSIWWTWLSWGSAEMNLIPTIVLTPLCWWWMVGRTTRSVRARGTVAGAIIGVVTQAFPGLLAILWEFLKNIRHPDHGGDLVMAAAVYIYLLVSMGAAVIGGILGWIAAWIQGRWNERDPGATRTSA